MKQTFKNLASGDELVNKPGQAVLQNLAAEKTNTLTPEKIELRTGVSQFIRISFEDGIEMQDGTNTLKLSLAGGLEISDGTQTTQLSLLQLLLNNGAGKVNTITHEQAQITDGTGSTTLSLLQLLHNNGSGKTNSVTDEQMVISETGKSAVYEVGSVTLTESGGSLELTVADGLANTSDGNTLTASGTGGINHTGGGADTAALSKSAGMQLGSSDGSVTVAVQTGEAISFQATEGCDEDGGGEPITTTAKVLRGAVTPV